MKVVILCGGYGTRLSEETTLKPKPMVEIGGAPILQHIMGIYSKFGFNDFVLALGYKGDYIKNFFLNYFSMNSDFTVDLHTGEISYQKRNHLPWKVNLIDTGLNTMTGGRLARLRNTLKNEENFMLTYGDGLCDINLDRLVSFHKEHNKIATVTSVRPVARFGEMSIENNQVESFTEKPQTSDGWINGGFFVFKNSIFDYLPNNDDLVLEKSPLESLARDKQLMAYKHDGFWHCMDTLRDKNYLESIKSRGNAPWERL